MRYLGEKATLKVIQQAVKKLGADATIDYRKSEDEQLQDLKTITGGNFFGVYDTVAKSAGFCYRALKEISTSTQERYYVTTDDWWVFSSRTPLSRPFLLFFRERNSFSNK